jgi:hypothetical protein
MFYQVEKRNKRLVVTADGGAAVYVPARSGTANSSADWPTHSTKQVAPTSRQSLPLKPRCGRYEVVMDIRIDGGTVQWIVDRLKEPSTYAGLAGLLIAFHVADASTWANTIMVAGIAMASIAAMVIKEKRHDAPPAK